MTPFLFAVISHTPLWVWAVFAALVAYGLKQTRTQDIGATRVWLAPVLVGAGSLSSVLSAFAPLGATLPVAGWIVGFALGGLSNRALDLPRRVSANADGSFRVEGSIAPLLLFVGVFALRYVTGVVLAVHPALASNAVAAAVIGLTYGLTVGLLAARSRKVWSSRGAVATPLAA